MVGAMNGLTASNTRRVISPRQVRTLSRAVHLLAAALLGVLIYAPTEVAEPMLALTRFVVVPALGLTGLLLWKQAQLRSLTRRLRS